MQRVSKVDMIALQIESNLFRCGLYYLRLISRNKVGARKIACLNWYVVSSSSSSSIPTTLTQSSQEKKKRCDCKGNTSTKDRSHYLRLTSCNKVGARKIACLNWYVVSSSSSTGSSTSPTTLTQSSREKRKRCDCKGNTLDNTE